MTAALSAAAPLSFGEGLGERIHSNVNNILRNHPGFQPPLKRGMLTHVMQLLPSPKERGWGKGHHQPKL